jgi:predicted metalloprotease
MSVRTCAAIVMAATVLGSSGCEAEPERDPPMDPVIYVAMSADALTASSAVSTFWGTRFQDHFTGSWTAPTMHGMYDSADPSSIPTCDGKAVGADNAWYCRSDHSVMWDAQLLYDGYLTGDAFVYFIIAHEYGHAVLAQLDASLQSAAGELQADCIAGFTLASVGANGAVIWEAGDDQELAAALAATADQHPWTEVEDHGSPEERIDAFASGATYGLGACIPASTAG